MVFLWRRFQRTLIHATHGLKRNLVIFENNNDQLFV